MWKGGGERGESGWEERNEGETEKSRMKQNRGAARGSEVDRSEVRSEEQQGRIDRRRHDIKRWEGERGEQERRTANKASVLGMEGIHVE
eukprot:753790-Hanusia_phi.AAC.9